MPSVDHWLPWIGQILIAAGTLTALWIGRSQRKLNYANAQAADAKAREEEAARETATKKLVYDMMTDTIDQLKSRVGDAEMAAQVLRKEIAETRARLNVLDCELQLARTRIVALNGYIDLLRAQVRGLGGTPIEPPHFDEPEC